MKDADFLTARYSAETEATHSMLADPDLSAIAATWFRDDTVDAWRHRRMYQCIDPLLEAYPQSTWLTIGDARYGTDAHYIESKGHRVMATNISDELLKISAERGYIREYQAENAERLSFPDNSFDFAFCKETYHHLPRPMLAVYEMLRVAREGIVLIEPQDAPLLRSPIPIAKRLGYWLLRQAGLRAWFPRNPSILQTSAGDGWEEVGNYIYAISEREIEKVAFGMGYAACAFKGINDEYEKGVETEPATPDSEVFRRLQKQIAKRDRRCQRWEIGWDAHGLLVAVIFKRQLAASTATLLARAGFAVKELPKNPYSSKTN